MIADADEARLLKLLAGGAADRDRGLRELFERTRGPLYALALRMTGRADLADDAVQETFVDLIRSHGTFRGDARLTTWLFRIAVRAATRVAGRARSSSLDPDELQEAASDAADPAEKREQRESAQRILRAIRSLPAPQRAVLALGALQELPLTEVAVVLGVPEGTVHSRLHHARKRLREALERE